MNIADPFLFQAKLNPAALAICTPGAARERVSYGRLERMVNNVGKAALARGLARGQVVAIDIKDKIFHAAVILGLARIGIVTVSARNPTLPKELGVGAVICDAALPYRNAGTVMVADQSAWALDGDGAPLADERLYRVSEDDPCRITLTSGTTGEARGVAFSHKAVAAKNARLAFARGNRFPQCSRFYCDLGLATDPGFRDMLHMLSKGGTIFYYGGDAESLIQAIDLYKIEAMIAAPSGLAEYLKFFEAYSDVACGFDHILTSGASLSRSLSERVRARMCANLYSTYGSTETGGVAVAPAHAIADVPGAVGFVTPGAAVEIVDEGGKALPAGREGSVRIRTAQTVTGYVGNPAEAETAFRDGWFYPGDIGCAARRPPAAHSRTREGGPQPQRRQDPSRPGRGRADLVRGGRGGGRVHPDRRSRHCPALGGGGAPRHDRRRGAAAPLPGAARRRLRAGRVRRPRCTAAR